MPYLPYTTYLSIREYKTHFEKIYCRGSITTFDGYKVRFNKSDFEHAFYESSGRNGIKDQFSVTRARRIDWILAALTDSTSDLRVGYDKTKKSFDSERRVAIVYGNYIAILSIISRSKKTARFITAFVASNNSLSKILRSPVWI
ncbi:hypothetical protein MASR1M36_15030 [Candidatus Cloacimonadaceae bacterium]